MEPLVATLARAATPVPAGLASLGPAVRFGSTNVLETPAVMEEVAL